MIKTNKLEDWKNLLKIIEETESCLDILERNKENKSIEPPLCALLEEILDYTFQDTICEEFHGSTYLYKSPVRQIINNNRMDLHDLEVFNTTNDIGQIGKLFRDSRYETFWILAVKDNKIIGARGVTNKLPGKTTIEPRGNKNKGGDSQLERILNIYKDWLFRIGADFYILLHNHPSNDITPTDEDKNITYIFSEYLAGFVGHIIVGLDCYTFIDSSLSVHSYRYEDEESVGEDKYNNDSSLMTTPTRLCRAGKEYLKSNDTSLVMYVSPQQRLVGVEQFKNHQLKNNDFGRYVYNQKKENHAAYAFLYTTSSEVMDDCGKWIITSDLNNAVYDDLENHKFYDKNTYEHYRELVPTPNLKDFYKYNKFHRQ